MRCGSGWGWKGVKSSCMAAELAGYQLPENFNGRVSIIVIILRPSREVAQIPHMQYVEHPKKTMEHNMDMSIFEMIMLICFGLAWPFSIYRSWKSRQIAGKSIIFLFALFFGYIMGILHKLFYSFDPVIFFYGLNGSMVLIDIALYFRNKFLYIKETAE
jgi:hypothetical protein